MKTARMILTATVLLSLPVTSYCSQQDEASTHDNNTITVTRKNSGIHHDGTMHIFGSGLDTLKNMREGKSYYGKPYGLGSDGEERWAKVGRNDIKKIEDALTFVAAVNAKGWILPEDAINPSKQIIQDNCLKPKQDAQNLMIAAHIRLAKSKQEQELLNTQIKNLKKQQTDADAIVASQIRQLQANSETLQAEYKELFPNESIDNSITNNSKKISDENIRSFIGDQVKALQK